MVQNATLFDAPHIISLNKENNCIHRRVASDYGADSSLPILNRRRNAIEKEISSSFMLVDHVSKGSNYYHYPRRLYLSFRF